MAQHLDAGTRAEAGSRSALVVNVSNVRKAFGAVQALAGVTLVARPGEVVCLIGPSGSGKSTLLRCINRLERIDSGSILVNGHPIGYVERHGHLVEDSDRSVAHQRQEVGMVFQRFNLFAHLTALENVRIGPVVVRRSPVAVATAEALQLLERVRLADKQGCYPAQLSGGQQQRVAIARALAMKPSVMLFDEATSALDPETTGEVLDVMKALARDGSTMIVATHEMGFAREVASTVVMMDAGQVIEQGPPESFFSSPAHPRTLAFLSKILRHDSEEHSS